jgi:ribosome biogenesis SPOUT family RNA methylase Rps3
MIPYVDHPEIKFNEHESTQMPFRYVKDENDKPIMPEVSLNLGPLLASCVPWTNLAVQP